MENIIGINLEYHPNMLKRIVKKLVYYFISVNI